VTLLLVVLGVAALDSLNPSTLGPALVLALGPHARRDVAAFTAGVFAVSAAGGLVLVFGPGRALLARIAKPGPHTQHLVEIALGAALLVAAIVLWVLRARLTRRLARSGDVAGRSAFLLGAGIMAVELPTAFPYFAGLVAVVEARRGVTTDVLLVLAYNVVFVFPLLLLLGVILVAGERGAAIARSARVRLERYAPVLFPAVLAALGVGALSFGVWGLK
jgi:cytochrome c biogenesis protein CcdA